MILVRRPVKPSFAPVEPDAVSVGWERQTAGAIDMDGLIRSAEQKMYADKERFYSQPGRERRRRC